jgi:2-oxo-hept-3-ene-1,7-dioate hydratase
MTPDQINKAAADLFQAEKTQKQINLLTTDFPDMQMDDAYAVQKALVELKTLGGCEITGWKINLQSYAECPQY